MPGTAILTGSGTRDFSIRSSQIADLLSTIPGNQQLFPFQNWGIVTLTGKPIQESAPEIALASVASTAPRSDHRSRWPHRDSMLFIIKATFMLRCNRRTMPNLTQTITIKVQRTRLLTTALSSPRVCMTGHLQL